MAAQTPETAPAGPTGMVQLMLEGRPVTQVGATFAAGGPLFALTPIASVLGAEVRIGPLGDSHTLIYEDRQILVGPGQSTLVTVAPDGRTEREFVQLKQIPVRDLHGLKLSLEALDIALGDPLNYRFTWRPDEQVLDISRPESRFLSGTISLRHPYQVSLIEIEFSAAPRYRVERSEDAMEIRLIGDRLQLPVDRFLEPDRLVTDVKVAPDRLRFELAPGAVAEEPRLLQNPRPRLVIEVFEGAAASAVPVPDERPRRARRRLPGVRTIVLDPGHGGEETGAVGPGGTDEASLNLRIAKALRLQLERRLPVKIIMTREEDVDIPLETRTAIANENQADLFISLHFNSSFGSSPRGAETYFLSREASDQQAAAFAAAENASAADSSGQDLDLQMILWDLAQTYHLAESQRFATLIQQELNQALGLRDRGVKQAPFTVLMGAKMPAVLVELGFLSNPEEEEKLQSPIYRAELVDSLVRAITRFKAQLESQNQEADGTESAGDDVPGLSGGGGSP